MTSDTLNLSDTRRGRADCQVKSILLRLNFRGDGVSPSLALRATPALLGLFSLVTLWANETAAEAAIRPRAAVWYAKAEPTFSDALAAVRCRLWKETTSSPSAQSGEIAKLPDAVLNRLIQVACFPA